MKKAQGIMVWLCATLFVVYAFCLNTASAVFSAAIQTSLQTDNLGTAIAVGAFIVGFATMQIPAGFLLDKGNPRFVVSAGVFLLALGNIMISYSTHFYLFAFSNFIQGMGGSFAFIAAGILISQWFSPKSFPILFGLTQTSSCLLTGVVHYYFVHELQMVTWNTLYQYLSIFGFCLFFLTLLFVKSPPDLQHSEPVSFKQSLCTVLNNTQMWLCTICAASSFGVLMAYAGFWYMNIQKFYAVGVNDTLIISGLIFAGIGIGTPIWGWVSNQIKSRPKIIHATLVLGCMALMLGIYLPHFHVNTLMIIKAISFLIGFFLSGSMLFYTIVSEISSDTTRGVALSVTNTGVFLTNSLMMFIPYLFITASSTTFFTYLWIFPFSVMFSILLVNFIKESYAST